MKITCETGTLADVIGKAARVAPVKGAGFDKAAGICLEINPDDPMEPLVVLATDLDVTFRSVSPVLDVSGAPTTWRVPSNLFASLISSLPMGTGKTVTLQTDKNDENVLRLTSGTTKARIRLIQGDTFPIIKPFPTDIKLATISDFAKRVEQVDWCTDKDKDGVLSGIYFDGVAAMACDRQRLVEVPCDIPLDAPVAAPVGRLSVLLKGAPDVSLAVHESRLLVSTDPETQLSTVVYADRYPDVRKIQRSDHQHHVVLSPKELSATLTRMLLLVRNERYPAAVFTFRKDSLQLLIVDPDAGEIQEEIPLTGSVEDDEEVEVWISPPHLIPALDQADAEVVTISFGPGGMKPVTIQRPNYRADLMPRKPGTMTATPEVEE